MVCILKGTIRSVTRAENSTCNTQPQSEKWYWRGDQDGGVGDCEQFGITGFEYGVVGTEVRARERTDDEKPNT